MSRVFWDSMLFIYMLDDHPQFSKRVSYLLDRSLERGDSLYTSYLAVGEVLAGAAKSGIAGRANEIRSLIDDIGFTYLPFGETAVFPFGRLRAETKLKVADAIHIATAAANGIDLFLTGDRQLVGQIVPGIQFIADFNADIL